MNKKIVKLILIATTLQVVESYFPHPVPGVRLGMANFVTLLAVVYFGLNEAVKIAVFRTICSSLVLGTFLSVSFIISFVSAIIAAVVMWGTYFFSSKIKFVKLSMLSISVTGAVAHNLAQLLVVYLLFIRQVEIFYLTPVLIISAVVAGIVTGMVALSVVKKLNMDKFLFKEVETGSNIKHNGRIYFIKPVLSLCFLVALFVVNTFYGQTFLFFLFIIFYLFSGKEIKSLVQNIKKVLWITLCSFFVPLIFNRYGKVLIDLQIFSLTYEGINIAAVYTLRIINLTIFSTFLTRLYGRDEMVLLLDKILFFYKHSGRIIVEFLTLFPSFFDSVKNEAKKIKVGRINQFVPQVVTFFVNILEQ